MAISETREKYLSDLSERFRDSVITERLYLQPHLSLMELTRMLGATWNDLSYAINHYLGKNFTDFINELRIAEAVRLLRDAGGEDIKVADLACQAGFADRTTFCRACKKITGFSPTELKSHLNTDKL